MSFSLVPPVDKDPYVITTMEAINATGVLRAVQDGFSHVSVSTVQGSMEEWISTKSTANEQPHPYSVILHSLVTEVRRK